MDQIKFFVDYVRGAHRSDEGVTVLEYSLLVALIAVAFIVGLVLLRADMEGLLTTMTAV